MNKEYLFVYGTLRKDFGLTLMQEAEESLTFVGIGKIQAVLYDLGDYPGAVKKDGASEIAGDVFEVKDVSKVFSILDEYEGEEYKREKVCVKMDTGDELDTWIYWYTGKMDEAHPITESDYLDYLKAKKYSG